MPWTLIAHDAKPQTGGGNAVTAALNTTGATLIIIATVHGNPASPDTAPFDNKANTWIPLLSPLNVSSFRSRLWMALGPSLVVGTGHTFTFPPGYTQALAVAAFGGMTPVGTLPVVGQAGTLPSPFVIGAINPIGPGSVPIDNALFVASAGWGDASVLTSNLTISDHLVWVGGQNYGVALAYTIQGTSAPISPQWSWTGGSKAIAGAASAFFLGTPVPNVTQAPRLTVVPASGTDAAAVLTQALRLVITDADVSDAAVRLTQAVRLTAIEVGSPVNLTQAVRLSVVAPPDPSDAWEGLGPHEDRFFIEIDLDTGMEQWALHDPMNDSPFLARHAGRKEGRLVTADVITRRTTDRLGSWQASNAQWTADDHDRRIRGLIAAGAWYNREFRAYVARRGYVENARLLGRFILREYPPTVELLVQGNGVDIIGSEFGSFSLDRDILGSVLLDKVRVPEAPKELQDAKPPAPIYMGIWSDESSAYAGVAVWKSYPLRGEPGGGMSGFGDMTSTATSPTSVTATALAGGTLDPTETWNNEFGFMVSSVDAAGKESDPYPFHVHPGGGGGPGAFPSSVNTIRGVQTVPKATVDGTQKIRVSWSGATGAVKYRVYMGHWYYLARWPWYIETTATSIDIIDTSVMQAAAFTGPNIWWYVIVAKLADGLTGKSGELNAIESGPRRIVRGHFTPIPGATEYLIARRGAIGGFKRLIHVPASQMEGGWVYFDDDQFSSGEAITELPVPHGLVPIIDIGDEVIASVKYGKFLVGRWAWKQIIGVYAGGARLADMHADVRTPSRSDWPFGAVKTRPLGDCDCTVIYLKGATLTKHRDGSAVVTINGASTETVGDSSGTVITQAALGMKHLVKELVFNDHKTGLWTGSPFFNDGTRMVDEPSYDRAAATQASRVGGAGYIMRLVLDKATTLRDFIQGGVQSFGLHHGINRLGQVTSGHYDDVIDPTKTYPLFTDAREIIGDIGITPKTGELETTIPYQHSYLALTQAFAVTDAQVEDAAAVALNRGKPKVGPQRTLAYTADLTTITDVMQRALLLGHTVRQWLDVQVSIVGLNVDIFDVVRITDEAGLGATGYQEAFMLVLEHEVHPPSPDSNTPLTVSLRGLDITALLDAAWVWGPDSLTTWDAMTSDQKGTYLAWATEADTIPSDNSDAREWR
jgi:hypothetical protein